VNSVSQKAASYARVATDTRTAQRLANTLGEQLEHVSASSFEVSEGQWDVEIHAADAFDQKELRRLVAEIAGDDVAKGLTFGTVETKDWVAASLEGLAPVEAGRFLIHGSHDRAHAARARIPIEIEAALAFGTGHHGTTRGCLVALDLLLRSRTPRNILDVGTGTGVLAIAAVKALHTHAVGSDIDKMSVIVARDNARLNHTPGIPFVHATGVSDARLRNGKPYDLIFANIILTPLKQLAAPLSRLLARNGRMVLSGLLPSHANAALSAYRMQGLMLERKTTLDGWCTLILRR
jgi:ribosomal protein L11 methyltransferase